VKLPELLWMADSFTDTLDAHPGLYLIKDTLQLSGRFVAIQCLLHLIKQHVQVRSEWEPRCCRGTAR
jgi:hypothetical protein